MKHSALWWLLIGWWWVCTKIVLYVTFFPFIFLYQACKTKPKDPTWIDRIETYNAFFD